MRFASAAAFVFVLIGAAAFACSDDDTGGPGTTGDGGVDGPIVKKEFPLTTPSIGGYTLVDAFPGVIFDIPAAIVWPKAAGSAPFVLERTGQIRTVENGKREDLLDFSDKVHVGGEGGAVGMALHPSFGSGETNQYVYVWYNACDAPGCEEAYTQRLERYTWDNASRTFDPDSALLMIEQRERENIHNAGRMLFGADGFLYFGNGDDGETANHQTITNGLFAGIFRIDVDMDAQKSHPPKDHTPSSIDIFTRQGYFIPNDNPFVGKVDDGLEEFWALGFRNPFSFSFDRKTGDMWMGDVGEVFREEVNKVVKGGNYEWPIKEGTLDYVDTKVKAYTVGVRTPPVFEYAHGEMGDLAAIFGGVVYRGAALPDLAGKYLYVDWISNRVWSVDIGQSPPVRSTLVDNQYKPQPLGIGEDNDGEFYVLEYGADVEDPVFGGGRIKKLARAPAAEPFPTRLVETYLFDDVPSLKPAANLIAYDVTSPLWSDGAEKQRWIRLPAGKKVTSKADGTLEFPVGTVFVKQFDLPASVTVPGRTRHLETRIMVVGSETTYGYTFRWNKEGTDARLVVDPVDEKITDTQTWHFPSFGQCWECHRNGFDELENVHRNDGYRILGFTAAQLGEQRAALAAKGVLDPSVSATTPALPKPTDTTKPIEERAHAYLAANCSPCHHENGSYEGGGQTWRAEFGAGDLSARHLDQATVNVPMSIRIGLPNAQLVAPGDPEHSILLARMKTNDPDLRMPPLARQVVDAEGAKVIEEWIRSLK